MAELHLPEEMIVRIFERLPIKPLIRFTSLSKRWRFIILYDPKFAKSHFQIASQHRNLTRRLLICKTQEPKLECGHETLLRGFESYDNKSSSSPPRKLRCPFSCPEFNTKMCSCNGLVSLVVSLTSIYIWNPSTGFYRTLPHISSEDEYVFHLGFGYVSSSDDYKIIASVDGNDGSTEDEVDNTVDYHILSLSANVWKKMEVPPNIYMIGDSTLLNEASHWLLYDRTDIIAAFDLAREEFRTMQLPISIDPTFTTASGLHFGLRLLGASPRGNLCLLDYHHNGRLADLWVLRDYGVADSWAKQFSFKISMIPYNIVWVMETSILLQAKEYRSGRWNFKLIRSGNEEEEELVISMDISDYFGVIDYQETLLWLP